MDLTVVQSPGSRSLRELEQLAAQRERVLGPLVELGSAGADTTLTFDLDAAPPTESVVLRSVPDGRTPTLPGFVLACQGNCIVSGQPTGVAALRPAAAADPTADAPPSPRPGADRPNTGVRADAGDLRLRMAARIVDFEARRDAQGRIEVYELPPDDGGGTFEVAGINDRIHLEEARHLASLVRAGRQAEAEEQAREIVATLTDVVTTWTTAPAVEFCLRDCAFNRGTRGAARILQRTLRVADDGVVGKETRAAAAERERDPAGLLRAMRAAREQYERDVAGRDESSRFWKGLVNRWDKALDFALSLLHDGAAVAPGLATAGSAFSATEAVVADALSASARPAFGGGAPATITPPPLTASSPVLFVTAPALGPAGAPVSLPALRLGSQGDLVRAWQSFLLGQHFDPGGLDGVFGDKTTVATKAFQNREGLPVDGVAGRQTILRATQLGFELIEEPAADASGSNFPPRPDFPPLVGTPARQAVFGRFDFVPEPRPDNKERIRILGTWADDNIVAVPIPQLRLALGAGAPASMRFHRLAARQLQDLWSDWERAGLLSRLLSFDGSFVPRFIRGSTTVLSNHAFGSAFDVNAKQNPLGARPPLVGERGSTRELVPIATRHGFYWGGHFGSRPDGMHFEVAVLR